MNKVLFTFCIKFIIIVSLFSQENYKQTIRGEVIDLNTEAPLIGASVIILDSDPIIGTVTDLDGNFRFDNITVGRQGIKVSYVGYEPVILRNLYLTSGKEMVLEIKLEEKIVEGEEIIIKAFGRKDKPINDMAQISARSFSVEETERYAGGIGDPARMASSFAGVLNSGTQVNDIAIRGNSPRGLLWLMDGMIIPNPNHFGSISSTGGTVSMLNNNVLQNSDFYTGAFPAEFGNALSGVFDLRMRNGNNEKREYLVQTSFNGFEAGLEGPFIKNKQASYMANYRYSTLAVFDKLGLSMGTPAIPYYEDLNFRFNFPGTKAGKFTIFGIGGRNHIGREDKDETDFDSFYSSQKMLFLGAYHVYLINENTSIKTGIGYSTNEDGSEFTSENNDTLESKTGSKDKENMVQANVELRRKINNRNNIQIGISQQIYESAFIDSFYNKEYKRFFEHLNINGKTYFFQSYIQWKHKLNNNFSFVGGIHYHYSKLGNDHSFEPRFSFSWDFLPKQSVNLGIGKHSQIQPHFAYFYKILDTTNFTYSEPNRNLELSRSDHFVLGYNYLFNKNLRLKIETYYQRLYNIPVEEDSSYMSLINYGSSFSYYNFNHLTNEGTGRNYGIELTFEKFLSDNYYYLLTLSLFDSKYKGSDNIMHNTRYNGNFILNMLGGYEWPLKNKNTLATDFKIAWAGGERKLPIDLDASIAKGETVYSNYNIYEEKFKDYFRLDFRISYRINLRKVSHTLAIDLMNATNRHNHFLEMYEPETQSIEEASIIGLMPSFLWRMNF